VQRDLVRALHVALQSGASETETRRLHYNATTARLDELINAMYAALRDPAMAGDPAVLYTVHVMPIVLAPFAPHLAEELWSALGHTTSVHLERWIDADPAALAVQTIEFVVQVNGKVRGRVTTPPGIDEDAAFALAMGEANVKTIVGDQPIRKRIYIKDKLLNLVV